MSDEQGKGTGSPAGGVVSAGGDTNASVSVDDLKSGSSPESEYSAGETSVTYSPNVDDPYNYHDDPYRDGGEPGGTANAIAPSPPAVATAPAITPPPPPPPSSGADEDEEEDGMLRMSFLEHLEELRRRILGSIVGLVVAYAVCLAFHRKLWEIVSAPAVDALKRIGADPNLAQLSPTDAFITIWIKVPLLTSVFVASPWILYQVWAFIAPGLYKRERRWAGPFVICTAGLFIVGGLFAYFVAFRFGLEFLLSVGTDINVKQVVSLERYFDLFVNVSLGLGLVFELPILVFFLTLLRITSPGFLLRNARYAILAIVVAAAIITPTPDVFNLMIFSAPMIVLFFVGVFASYLLVLHRENRRFPWKAVGISLAVVLAILGGVLYFAVTKYGYKLVLSWPFLTR